MRKFERLIEPQGAADDLTRINGIGPALAKALNKAGVFHFWQIAVIAADDLPSIEPLIGFRGRLDWEAWIEEARELVPPESLEPLGGDSKNSSHHQSMSEAEPGSKPGSADGGVRKPFEVISPILMNRKLYAIGERIELTRDEHKELKAAGAIAGEW